MHNFIKTGINAFYLREQFESRDVELREILL